MSIIIFIEHICCFKFSFKWYEPSYIFVEQFINHDGDNYIIYENIGKHQINKIFMLLQTATK